MSVWKWKMVCARKHVYSWGEFAIHFLKNYKVKWVEKEYSNNQGPWEQDSIERTSKHIKKRFVWLFENG